MRAVEFRGGHYKVTAFVDALAATLRVEISRAQRDSLGLVPGTPVAIVLPAKSALLFRAAQEIG